MSESLHIVAVNDLAELDRINQLVEEFGEGQHLHVEERYAIYLCLEEIFTNIVKYAWPEGGEHAADIRLSVEPDHIKISIEDDGIQFDPTKVPEPDTTKPAHERQIGGLGLHLVRQNVDEMRHQRMDDVNILILTKRRKVAAPAA